MRKAYSTVVVATAGAHLAYLVYLPSGGFLALRWRRTLWVHVLSVCWGVGVVGLRLQCPLTSLEAWARQRAGMAPLPETGFIGRYVGGVLLPTESIGTAQKLAFSAAAASWLALAVQRRKAGVSD